MRQMRRTSGAARAVLILALCLVLALIMILVVSKLTPASSDDSVKDADNTATVTSHEVARQHDESVRALVTVQDAPQECRIDVLDEDVQPLASVLVFPVPEASLPPETGTAPLGETDEHGQVILSSGSVPASARVGLWRAGYCPELIEQLQPNEVRRVVLHKAHGTRILVQRPDGSPVAGFRIALARVDPTEDVTLQSPSRSSFSLRVAEKGGNAFLGVSDSSGAIDVLGLPKGRYYLQCNLGCMPVSTRRAPPSIELPAPAITLTVDEYWAVAIKFMGDEVIARSSPTSGRNASGSTGRSA